jgi:hypothetical protein
VNTLDFFLRYFGHHFLDPHDRTGDPLKDTVRVLHASHPVRDKSPSRFTTGNVAVIRARDTVLRGGFDVWGIRLTDVNSTELIARTLLDWDDEPVMLLTFEKVLFPPDNLFVTYDLRRVRVCNAKAVHDVNFVRVLEADKPAQVAEGWERRLFGTVRKLRAEQEAQDAA